jgi:hypothetical protein
LNPERFKNPVSMEVVGAPAQEPDYSTYAYYFCRDMPVMPFEIHPELWTGAHLKVRWGVLDEAPIKVADE